MNKIVQLTLALVLAGSIGVYASDNHFDFANIGIGARPSAMGKSFTAIANDSSAIFWNPAGLARLNEIDASLMIFSAFETNYKSAQIAAPFMGFTVGFGYIGANVDGALSSSFNNATGLVVPSGSTFGYQGNALYLSLAKALNSNFSVGVTSKYISERLDTSTGSGYGLDVGALYTMYPVTIGLNIQNLISPAINWDTPSRSVDTIPLTIRGGVAVALLDNTFILSVDGDYRKNRPSPFQYHIGGEYWLYSFLPFRAGIDYGRITLGTGIRLQNFVVDFAWSAPDVTGLYEDAFRVSFGYSVPVDVPMPPVAPTEPVAAVQPEPIVVTPTIIEAPVVTPSVVIEDQPIKVATVSESIPATPAPVTEPTPAPSIVAEPLSVSVTASDAPNGMVTHYALKGGKSDAEYVVGVYVRDAYGMKVKDLVAEKIMPAGDYQVNWDLTSTTKKKVQDDEYLIRVVVSSAEGSFVNVVKVLIRNGRLVVVTPTIIEAPVVTPSVVIEDQPIKVATVSESIPATPAPVTEPTPAPSIVAEPLSVSVTASDAPNGMVTHYVLKGGKSDAEYVVGVYVRDAYGMKVKDLVAEKIMPAGDYQVNWDLTSTTKKKVQDDEYLIRVVVSSAEGSFVNVVKVLIRNGRLMQ